MTRVSPTQIRYPAEVLEGLKERAVRNDRSLNNELVAIAEEYLANDGLDPAAPRPDDDLFGATPAESAFNRSIGSLIAMLMADNDFIFGRADTLLGLKGAIDELLNVLSLKPLQHGDGSVTEAYLLESIAGSTRSLLAEGRAAVSPTYKAKLSENMFQHTAKRRRTLAAIVTALGVEKSDA